MFESARLKTERADQHIRELETTFRAFIKENPHRVTIHPNAETGQVTVGSDFGAPLYPHISTITGDAIHNFRTALDHLACALVRANGGTVKSYTGFPFHEERGNFESNFEGKIKGASQEAINLVRSMEPYKGGNGEALWLLNKLDVADKHHSLILSARVATLPKIVVRNPDGGVMVTMENCSVGGDGRVNMMAVPSGCSFEIEQQDKAPISIFFRETNLIDGEDVFVSLKNLSKIVLSVIETFDARKNLFSP